MAAEGKFNDQWVQLIHGLIQNAPPNGLMDIVQGCRQLVGPAKVPDELVFRSCADFREKSIAAVPLPASNGQGIGIICEIGRAGSRASKVIAYHDQRHDDQLFCVDQETGQVSSVQDRKKSGDLSAEMANIDIELAKPYKDALDVELDLYIAQRYPPAKNGAFQGCEGLSGASVYSLGGKDIGDDIELRIVLASKRIRRAGFWAGNWTSQWRIVFVPEQKEPVILGGVLEFKTHYAEDSNIHFNRKATKKTKIHETADPEKWAKEVVAAMKEIEDEFHHATEDICLNMGAGALKAMRRVLPLSKERFDWRPIRHSLVRDMKNVETKEFRITHGLDDE
mmetsp:Transcript_85330/g.275386  ORF Transcript_85330/g.275386 Transcript_85330/m.275386 type:complete len:337 (+) Transcript_85330:102-1112(+)